MKNNFWLKIKAGFTILVLVLAFFAINVDSARAGGAVVVVQSIPEILRDAKLTISEKIAKIFKTFGAKLVGTTVRNTLNRVALDAAKYVASAGEGQKPTYVVQDFGTYWKNIGDAAAGDFIDGLGKNWGADLCQPPDANIQAKIGLGLVQTVAPTAPNCTLSKLVTNYSSAYEKYAAMTTGDFLKGVQLSVDPNGSELGGAFTIFGRTFETSTQATADEKAKNTITQGWLNVRDIAGNLVGTPNQAEHDLAAVKNAQTQNLLSTTGDALVDAANTFLNQLAYEGFQRILRELNKGQTSGPLKLSSSGFDSLIQYGESIVGEKLADVVKPHFDVRSDYSILSELAICPDINNPGPTNCVIDDKFSQAISEKVTVGDALAKGYLHGDWLISNNNKSNSTYTLRSASILRKYRIIPIGWEQAILAATSKGYKVTLQDLVSCFDGNGPFSADFDRNNQAWCRGLVDPNWVLKSPLNSCAKQGFGNQILSSLISKDASSSDVLSISRATDYCADDQTCIKEKTDGSCEVYGYCNEEKRTWKFGTDSCEPVYNTCQTFTNVSNKQTASFLENTLDYSTCNANNSGCNQYSYNGSYSSSTNSIIWDKNYSIFFNNKVANCDASNEGCTKLLRGKPGWVDVNYVMDSDFNLNSVGDTGTSTTATWHWPVSNGSGTIINDNGKALSVSGIDGASLVSVNDSNLLPKNLSPISGWSYTLSADVKLDSGNQVVISLGDNGDQVVTSANTWTTVSVTANNTNNLNFAFTGNGPSVKFSVRNLKLTPNNYYTGYSNYAAFPVHEKLLPNYLENTCYNSTAGTGDYTIKDNAPDVCSNFARKCNRAEVGCELFTSVKDIFAVAAKANVNDYCDASCVGYDTYIAKASYFAGTSADNLIPANTRTCGAESAGCSSFTNLDAVSQGGESVEYYTKVRQCIKPDTTSCSDFYSWDSAQLKVVSLKRDAMGDPFVVNSALDSACTKEIYNLPVTDPRYNADCREFYNKGGQITYHLISNTVSCSDNCHVYRLNEKNSDKTLNASSCTGADKNWDATQNVCNVCQNGGVWDTKQSSCVYSAVPNEGTTCTAADLGCREYNGNNGNSLKLVASYDFEDSVSGFYALKNGDPISQSTESTVKNGHSLNIINGVGVDASGFAKKDSAYVAKFMAKAPGAPAIANISLENNNGEAAVFGVSDNNPNGNITINNDGQWHLYEVNLQNINHEVTGETLKIKVNNSLVIDNLIINEVTDRYYLIQGSSQVPDVCSYDMSDKYQGPSYNLGCAAYTDRAGTTHNLHQFSELCQNSAVGCELMIQTNNSSNFYGYNTNLNGSDKTAACAVGTPGCIEVKDNQAIYAVFDPTKQCNQADAGCTRFGNLKTIGNSTSWVDSYKKNLPDSYNNSSASPLCQANEVGCDTWSYGDGSASYFKTPGLNTCVFKNNVWYKSPVKRCDINGTGKFTGVEAVCLTDADCGTKKCVTDTKDYPCNISYLKTIGLGGLGGRIATPDGSVGLCNTTSAGCGEYIDPVSKYVSNLIYNPTADKVDNISADKWTQDDKGYYQRISIVPNKLYILKVAGAVNNPITLNNFSISKDGSGGLVRILGADNKLGEEISTISATNTPVIFNSGSNNYLTVYRTTVTLDPTNPAASISIKEAVINYQLNSSIDTNSCNGTINTDAGCVLFNARTQIGSSGLKQNIFNADLTADGAAPQNCSGSNCTANTVIKVSPDRVCSRWLSCQTYSEDPITHERTCYKMGECDQLNDKNECGNFLASDNTVNSGQDKNATGYSLLNNYYIGAMKEVGQNTDAHFDFEDANDAANLTCSRNVDVSSGNTNLYAKKDNACPTGQSGQLVLTPDKSPTDYPAHGKGYLKVLNYTQVSPGSSFSVYANQDYYINYLVNTKGSNSKAKLLIVDNSMTTQPVVYARFTDQANNGWERRIYKFNIVDRGKKNTQVNVKIYLSSDTTSVSDGYVYFDDINIEPVLQTGTNSYSARDCRLYPSSDSLSCLSVNNNVIKDGLYGYCLQYDLLNPGVCLMWYPADNISSFTGKSGSQLNLGYAGKFPLDYCTEANGNFDLVKKLVLSPVWFDGIGNDATLADADSCYYYNRANDSWTRSGGAHLNSSEEGTRFYGQALEQKAKDLCQGNYQPVVAIGEEHNNSASYVEIACVPIEEKLLSFGKTWQHIANMHSCNNIGYYEGFVKYDGVLNNIPYTIADNSNTTDNLYDALSTTHSSYGTKVCSQTDKEPNWCTDPKYTGLNEATSIEGSVRVLDYNNPPVNGDGLKYISNSSDNSKVYRITCNKFSQLVDSVGNDKAWTGRVSQSSIFSSTTPTFFSSNLNLLRYGRENEDVPFGAANLPSDYNLNNSDRISLRNQYSKNNNETVLAGRPYGCSGTSCDKIGQCSGNPSIYCILTGDTTLNDGGCSFSGAGTCQKLWVSVPTSAAALTNLNTLFVSKYADYVYSSGGYIGENVANFIPPSNQCPSSPRTNNIYCVNYPTISNEKLESGSLIMPISNGNTEIKYGGLYQLEFDAYIDDEQQPLKQLQVYWGVDDGIQSITNFDNTVKEDASGRKYYHISLTHYYLRGTKHLEVKVFDNWGAFKCSAMSGNDWLSGSCSVL